MRTAPNRFVFSLLCTGLPLWTACGASEQRADSDPPATVENPRPETDLSTLRLTSDAERRLGITLGTVDVRPVGRYRTLGGELVTPQGGAITVSAPVAGTVIAGTLGILAAGFNVTANQEVFRLIALPTEDDLLRIREDVQVREAQHANAQARAARARRLLEDSLGSLEAFEDAETKLRTAEATLRAAKARQDLLTQPGDSSTVDQLTPLSITSPITGRVRAVFAGPGQSVSSGAPLFEVVSMDPLWVKVPIYVGDELSFDTAAPAQIGRLGRSEDTFITGRPIQAPPSADPGASSIDFYYEVRNPRHQLRPGQRVGVTIRLRGTDTALTVPWSAILFDIHGNTWIYERVTDGTYVRRRVSVRYVADSLAVLDRGPPVETEVVITGAAELFGTEFGTGK